MEEILEILSPLDVSWEDDHARAVNDLLHAIPTRGRYTLQDLETLLDRDFHAGMTTFRLFLDLSKDQFEMLLRTIEGGAGVNRYRKDKQGLLSAISELGLLDAMQAAARKKVVWQDILIERLKSGRGSAIRGQRRGRHLEDIVEAAILRALPEVSYHTRCRFRGASGFSDEKADFAIPSKDDPYILIEAKGYGATGSKQTDIIGDVNRIVQEKRHDTHFLLVTDGLTWRLRKNDLKKLVEKQNLGLITRIYTQRMIADLEADLRQLRREFSM